MTAAEAGRRRFLLATLTGALLLPFAPGRLALADEEPAEPPPDAEASPEETPPAPAPRVVFFNGHTPVSMAIPKLGVDAAVVGVGQDPDGTMSIPPDPDTVAWYTLGPGMGVGGNAVFAGHVDWGGRHRVFAGLTRLSPGDAVLIVDEKQNGYQYRVESGFWVKADSANVEEIFAQPDNAMITLITCGGDFNLARREYIDRFIVKARGA